jgi:hypothetical protein
MLHARGNGHVTVFDRDREGPIRFRVPMDVTGDMTWRRLHRVLVLAGIVPAEDRLME